MAKKKHALLSASSAHRWLECTPSAVAAALYADTDTVYTVEGTKAHKMAEEAVTQLLAGVELFSSDEMSECALQYAEYVQEFISSPDTLVFLEQQVDLTPWVPEGFGTCDCILIQGSTLTVIDYKYGVGVPVSAEGNPQTRLYALGAINDFGLAYDFDTVEMVIFQPRIERISTETLSVADLLAWAEDIKPLAAQAYDGRGDYKAGSWCKFCPHAGRCKKLTDYCIEKVTVHRTAKKVPVLAPWEVAEVLALEPMINLWLKRVREQALTTMLSGGEIPGYKVVEGRGNRSWTNEGEVFDVLTRAGFAVSDITKTELLSPAAMEKALGKKPVADMLSNSISKAPGAPTIAPETDKRPVYDRLAEAKEDFKEEYHVD